MTPDPIIPRLPGELRKNDALFLHGACQPLPWVFSYEQRRVEVVYGPSCKPDKEIRLDACRRDGVPVTARRGGGGTVVLSPGTVVTVVVGEREGGEGPRALFSRIHRAFVAALDLADIDIQEEGLSDLAVGSRKILGSSLYLTQSPPRFFYQSSLLVTADISLFERYLFAPPRQPDYRRGRGHGEFCTTLERAGAAITPQEACARIAGRLERLLL